MDKKEHELNQAALRYFCACGQEDDWKSLRETGFGRKEIEALSNLSFNELHLLEQELDMGFARIRAERDMFWEAMSRMRARSDSNQTRAELISRDAPADLMKALYGIGTKEYTRLRRASNVSTGVGRPVVLDEEAILKIWTAWRVICPTSAQLIPKKPEQWIRLCDETEIDIRSIWGLIKQYLSNPSTSSNSPPGSSVNSAKKEGVSSNSNSRRKSV